MTPEAANKINGGCYCGSITFEMELSRSPQEYGPRSCDCDFCLKHGAAYVSDPHGNLSFHIKEIKSLRKYRQDDTYGIAEFLLCINCGVLVGVIHEDDGKIFGAVNSLAVENAGFGEKVVVSPRLLARDEKIKRWKQAWFSNVRVAAG